MPELIPEAEDSKADDAGQTFAAALDDAARDTDSKVAEMFSGTGQADYAKRLGDTFAKAAGALELTPDEDDEVVEPEPEAKEPSDKTKESETSEAETRGFDEGLLSRAQELGLSREQALLYSGPEELTRAIESVSPTPTPEPAPVQQPDQPGIKRFEFNVKKEAFKEDADADTMQFIEDTMAMRDHFQSQIEELMTVIGSMYRQQSDNRTHSEYDRMDSAVRSLGDEYAEFVGKDHWQDVNPSSEQGRTRFKIFRRAMSLGDEYRRYGDVVPPMSKLVREAAGSVLADKVETVARKKVQSKVNERRSQSLARPSGRKKSPLRRSAYDSAVEKLTEKMRDKGLLY